jgi:hypothetical protein
VLKAPARPVDQMVMTFLRPRRHRALPHAAVSLAAVLPLAVAGCGGSTRPSSPPAHVAAASSTTTAPSAPAVTGGRLVSAGALRATLSGENHAPRVNRPWRYAVTVTNAGGQPISGTVAIEFLFAGQVVAHDKPPTHPITNGLWESTLKLPTAALGYPLTLRAIAHTPAGSITLNWPITTKR